MKTPVRIGLLFTAAALAFVLFGPVSAEGGWLIDPAQYHASAHRELSCTTCHDRSSQAHPDPAVVNRNLASFFDPEVCLSCHPGVAEDLSQGRHGGRDLPRKSLAYCLTCHDPHTLLGAEQKKALAGRLDPNRPVGDQCAACHDLKTELPAPAAEDSACLSCHRTMDAKELAYPIICLSCHGQGEQGGVAVAVGKIDLTALKLTAHGRMNCLACHSESARFRHSSQERQDCRVCHAPHDAKTAHEVHARVTCEACHMAGLVPTRRERTGWIVGLRTREAESDLDVHGLVSFQGQAGCIRCHHSGNRLGATAWVLPPKSILCAPCHVATLSAGHPVTLAALAIFVLGLAGLGGLFWRASAGSRAPGESEHRPAPLGKAVWAVANALVLDAVLGRRLIKNSTGRWLIHGLIFYPILFRFVWGLVGLLASLTAPRWPVTWVLLDASHPLTAFLFDLSGGMMLAGAVLAMGRRLLAGSKQVPELPPPDWVGIGLLALLLVSGFMVEGFRLAMAGNFDDKGYAFIGSQLGRLLGGLVRLPYYHSVIWYVHFVVTGLFVAYLPFGRMLHFVLAPLSLALGAARRRAGADKEDKR